MDTLAKETMGLPIFICASNQQIISSGNTTSTSSTSSALRSSNADSAAAPLSPTSPTSSTLYSPTTSFFATSTATRSPVSVTFPSVLPSPQTRANTTRDARRNTYTPPTFSPSNRRESLLSTHRLSAAFDFASTFASEVLSKAADQVFGNEETRTEAGMLWNEDLEAGERQREKERKEKGGRYSRFGEEGAFESWLD